MTLSVLVVDDEQPARERLQRLLTKLPGYHCCGSARNGQEALRLNQEQNPDIILLDIRMPGLDGIQVAQQLAQLNQPPALVFCTAYGDYALKAFQVNAVAYVMKPVSQEVLAEALASARRINRAQLSDTQPADDKAWLSISTHRGIERIALPDIYYFSADHKYVSVVHRQGETVTDMTLKQLEVDLGDPFIRIHRNALVNSQYIQALHRSQEGHAQVKLRECNACLDVSRRHLSAVKSHLKSV